MGSKCPVIMFYSLSPTDITDKVISCKRWKLKSRKICKQYKSLAFEFDLPIFLEIVADILASRDFFDLIFR